MTLFTPEAAARLKGPEWLRARRTAAAERFAALELPTEAEEIWRYSRISELGLDAYTPAREPAEGGVPAAAQPGIAAAGERSGLLVTRDGHVVHAELDEAAAGRGVVVGDLLDHADADDLLGSVASSATDAFTELNTAFVAGAALVHVPRGVVVEKPVVVVHHVDGDGAAVFPRTVVRLEESAQATVIER